MLQRSLILGCFFVGLSACAPAVESAGSPRAPSSSELATQEQSISKALDDYHDAAAKADEKRYFDHFTEDGVFLGTDATERWTKAEFQVWAKPYFARGKAWTFHATRRAIHVDSAGAIAWFDEDLTTGSLGPSRGSGVLVLKNGTWLISQYNLAITVPNDQLDGVKEMLQVGDNRLAEKDPLERFAWLTGSWRIKMPNGEITEETWTAPSGGMMVGMGRTVQAGKPTFHEYLRIEARGDQIVYLAQPKGEPATEFVLVPGDGKRATFENAAHDWPKRIRYERTNAGLAVRIEGDAGKPVEEWTYAPMVMTRGR